MNFIVYGNEDSPVVPILLYEPGKVTYVVTQRGKEREGGGGEGVRQKTGGKDERRREREREREGREGGGERRKGGERVRSGESGRARGERGTYMYNIFQYLPHCFL